MPKAKEKPKGVVPRFKDREAMEAATRQLTPERGVRECDFLRLRYWKFHRSEALVQAGPRRAHRRAEREEDPLRADGGGFEMEKKKAMELDPEVTEESFD